MLIWPPVDLWFNAILVLSSVVLFCYWFRYCCLLILAAEMPQDFSNEVAEANQLAFPEVRTRLRQPDAGELKRLHACLERDFAILARLLERTNTAAFDPSFEDVMLRIHFRSMSTCFRLTSRKLQESSTAALEEMTRVVTHLANQLGENQTAAKLPLRTITAWK